MFFIKYLDTGTPVLRRVNVVFGIPLHAYTQLPGLVVTVCPARHTYLSISGRVHNRHCYCYWCYTHITVIGPLSPILRFCYRYYLNRYFKMVFVRYYLYSECIEKYYVIVTEIIVTVFEMVCNGYYINSNYIIALGFLKYTFMKYFEFFYRKYFWK